MWKKNANVHLIYKQFEKTMVMLYLKYLLFYDGKCGYYYK